VSGAAAAGVVADAAVEDLRRLERAVERDLLRILLSLDTVPGEDSLVRRQAQTSAAVLAQVRRRLEAEGETLAFVVGRRAIEAVGAVMGAPPSGLSVSVREELDLIVSNQLEGVVATFKAAVPEMREAVARGIASSGSLADVVEDVRARLATTYQRASAAVDAAIMAAGRHAIMAAAREVEGDLDLVYVYVGPRDDKNRPFCRLWVGKAVTDPARLDNGQGLPVDDYCGGYNCRHSWAPTPFETAVRENIPIYRPDGSVLVVDVGTLPARTP
jgi:hypothetical protein